MVERIGRYQNSSGPELGTGPGGQQTVSGTINEISGLSQINKMGAWMGIFSGNPIVRLVVYADSNGAPGEPLAYTEEITPSASYSSGGGGAMYSANLVNSFMANPGTRYWVGVTSRNGTVGIAMIGAGSITEPDERFHRKNIDGNMPTNGSGSSVVTAGHLMIYAEGVLAKPNVPDQLSPSGTTTGTNVPRLSMRHTDPNGRSATRAQMQVRRVVGGATVYDSGSKVVSVTHGGDVVMTYGGATILYGQQYQLRGRTFNGVAWSDYSEWQSFTINPEAQLVPDQLSPSGNVNLGNINPTFTFRHRNANGLRANRGYVQVRPVVGGGLLMNVDFLQNPTIANNGTMSRVYSGATLQYYTQYEWRARTHTTEGWGEFSDWERFTLEHANRPPYQPIILAPFPNEAQKPADITLFTSQFRDPDSAWPGMANWERSSAARVIVKNTNSNQNTWDSGWQNRVVANNGITNITYTGPTLAYNITYQFIYQHKDRSGAESPETIRQVTFRPGGSVEEPINPKGRITNPANPGNVSFKYVDSDGVSGSAFQVRIVNESGNQVAYSDVKTGGPYASGSTLHQSWSGLSWNGNPSLLSGQKYGIQARVRHSITGVMSEWSPSSWITINAAPSVPTLYSPNDGAAFSSKPSLVALVTDPDQSPTELTVQFQIATDEAFENVIATTAGVMTAGGTDVGHRGRFEKDLAAVGITIGNTYWWRAYAYDGYLYSGDTTSAASSAQYTTPKRFTYANVPSVTITSLSTVATSQPLFTWSTPASQTRYQVILTDEDGVVAYDSGEVFSDQKQHLAAGDGWVDGRRWQNYETLFLTVRVFDSLWGQSSDMAVTLEYIYPDSVESVVAEPISPDGHVGDTVILISHAPTSYNEEDFVRYNYYRIEYSRLGEITRINLKGNSNISEPWLEDWTVESGKQHTYEVTQTIRSGVDEIESSIVTVDATANWDGVVLHLPFNPGMYNAHLRVGPAGDSYGHTKEKSASISMIEAPSMRKRVAALGMRQDVNVSGEYGIFNDRHAGISGRDLLERLEAIMDCAAGIDSPDGRPHVVCWREGRGGRGSVVYGVFAEGSEINVVGDYNDVWEASLALHDVGFVLGEDTEES